MNPSINDLDIHFPLSMFAAVMERGGGLLAIREKDGGRLLYVNEEGMKMLGSTDLAVLEALLQKNDLGACDQASGNSVAGGRPIREERDWVDNAGQRQRGLYERILFKNAGKEYCFCHLTTITSDNYYQRKIEKELQRFGALFDYASIGILVTNRQGEVIMINDFALEQFGYQREELLGLTVEQLLPPQLRNRHIAHRDRYAAPPSKQANGYWP